MNMARDYVAVVYDEKIRPKTGYPFQLAGYLIKRFSIQKNCLLIDAGSGRGDFAVAFKQHGVNVEGMDISDVSIQSLQQSGIQASKLDLAAQLWPYPDNSADVIFSKSVLGHLPSASHYMKECYRILKPGGRVVIMTPDWESGHAIFYDDPTHVHPYTTRGIETLLLMSGFRQVTSEKFYQLPVIWKFPALKLVSRLLQTIVPPNPKRRNKFIRWSVELMCLGTGLK